MRKTELPDFSKARVLVIGDIMLDRYWFGETARISPEAPVPVVKVNQIDDRPGGAGNVALNIAALGAQVKLIGVTGDDPEACILMQQLQTAGALHEIIRIKNIPTITKLRVISRHQQLIRLDFEERFPIFDSKDLMDAYQRALTEVNLVIISDYNKGTLTNIPNLIMLAHAAGLKVLVDPKGNNYTVYNGADVITPNLKEFEAIVGTVKSEKELALKAQYFLQQHHINAMLLTRGERGMTLFQRENEEYHLPAHAREVYDVTGAGDTVIAVLGAVLAAEKNIKIAMELANLAAGIVVSKLGAATVSGPELKVSLAESSKINTGIMNEEQLMLAINEAKDQDKKVVFTNGCFDILHAGHVTYLQQAKQLGDYLVVATNDDASIKRLKGSGRPINNVEQRMAVLSSLGVVDWVISFTDDTPKRLLKLLQPNILAKGGDYSIDQVVGCEIVWAYGGDVRVLGLTKGLSTTSLIDRMVKSITQEKVAADTLMDDVNGTR